MWWRSMPNCWAERVFGRECGIAPNDKLGSEVKFAQAGWNIIVSVCMLNATSISSSSIPEEDYQSFCDGDTATEFPYRPMTPSLDQA